MGQLIWINGPFGVGKTTVAEILCGEIGALFFDPEELGFLLRDVVPKSGQTGDFQDIRLWRTGLIHLAQGLCKDYAPPVVMPMTIYNSAYVREVKAGLARNGVVEFHVVLMASKEVVSNRIRERSFGESAEKFALQNLGPSLSALTQIEHDLLIDTTHVTAEDCARQILSALPGEQRH